MKNTYQIANARRYKRLKADYLVKYKVYDYPGAPSVSNIKDISAGGLRFWSRENLPLGALLQMSVLLPPVDREIKTIAKVVRVRPAQHGFFNYAAVSFIELSGRDQEAIDDFVEYIAKTEAARDLIDHFEVILRKAKPVGTE
jgi:c-di-GMP-binding flagellar brake protein YcgR